MTRIRRATTKVITAFFVYHCQKNLLSQFCMTEIKFVHLENGFLGKKRFYQVCRSLDDGNEVLEQA